MESVMINVGFVAAFCWFTVLTIVGSESPETPMYIRVFKVSHTSAAFDWYINQEEKQQLVNCEVNYGPISDPTHLEVLPNFLPDRQTFHISKLDFNVSYHFYMVCLDAKGNRYASNRINFTTGSEVEDPKPPSSLYQSNWDLMDDFYPTSARWPKSRPSSSVILGAVCGIVGFLIINATLIVAVRRCSQAQMRRRRLLNIPDDLDYNEAPYGNDVEAARW